MADAIKRKALTAQTSNVHSTTTVSKICFLCRKVFPVRGEGPLFPGVPLSKEGPRTQKENRRTAKYCYQAGFGIIEFLFIKINQNYWFAGNERDDNVKNQEVIVIDRLVQKDPYHFEYSRFECRIRLENLTRRLENLNQRVNVLCILTF